MLRYSEMDKEVIVQLAESGFQREDLFLVDVEMKPGNVISVIIDGMKPVSLDDCIKVSRNIEGNLDREVEDFSLTVTSAGMGVPFKVWRQYEKNVGREVEVVLKTGEKLKGVLASAKDNSIELKWETKEKIEGKKKKETVEHSKNMITDEIKSIKTIIKF